MVAMHPYTLAIERFPSPQIGGAHHGALNTIEAKDDAEAIRMSEKHLKADKRR